ncbi:MAG: hypothetical protein A3A27_00705 [Candidatus Wildermuthbacteria bacterium RIFCSPLOWO2_01_FULL_47_18]|uniref:Uncharacterized protein n=1 Tax=Candidatus Wildermuthbacteria bacterium RIFCSPLOWO2_01_FULL_47_18 TaxID=1802460 RepID=A0A1G2RG71_9BACT|nr:MAG: hypothetical protein A3A27_00705 [Candidatus Wildermuthbacteria bacterium RIFCSPLOWO2_01_FULL_47_18]
MVTEVKVTPEASTVLLAPMAPSKVTVALVGKVEVLSTVKLPLIVRVGLEAVVRVSLAPLVNEPIEAIPAAFVCELTSRVAKLLRVMVPLLVMFPF